MFLNNISGLQLLQKENAQLTSKMKELLGELDNQKEQNKVLIDEVSRLATSLKDFKVPNILNSVQAVVKLMLSYIFY